MEMIDKMEPKMNRLDLGIEILLPLPKAREKKRVKLTRLEKRKSDFVTDAFR